MRKLLVGLVAVAALGVTGLSGVARAAVACGDTITQNTVLDADVGPCPFGGGWGIKVGADNVTLDLNGHTVSGTSVVVPSEGAGVYVYRRTGVTVKNGTVRWFDGGVIIEGGSANTVTGVTARDNIGLVGTTKYADGIAILSSVNNQIVNNQAVHNGPLSGIAIYSRVDSEHARDTSGASTGNLIDHNRVIDSTPARSPSINDNDGIRIETQSELNTISYNTVSGSGLDGISIFSFTPNNTVRYNTVYNNGFLNPFRRRGDGIRVFGGSSNTTVQFNQAYGNAANGIIFHGVFNTPSGPRPPVTNSRATDNSAVGNAVLPPIEMSELGGPVYDLLDGQPTCDNNVWLRNRYHTASPDCTKAAGQQV